MERDTTFPRLRRPSFSIPPTKPPLSFILSRSALGSLGYSCTVSAVRCVFDSRLRSSSYVIRLFDHFLAKQLLPYAIDNSRINANLLHALKPFNGYLVFFGVGDFRFHSF
jgi:hypothetical protein